MLRGGSRRLSAASRSQGPLMQMAASCRWASRSGATWQVSQLVERRKSGSSSSSQQMVRSSRSLTAAKTELGTLARLATALLPMRVELSAFLLAVAVVPVVRSLVVLKADPSSPCVCRTVLSNFVVTEADITDMPSSRPFYS